MYISKNQCIHLIASQFSSDSLMHINRFTFGWIWLCLILSIYWVQKGYFYLWNNTCNITTSLTVTLNTKYKPLNSVMSSPNRASLFALKWIRKCFKVWFVCVLYCVFVAQFELQNSEIYNVFLLQQSAVCVI